MANSKTNKKRKTPTRRKRGSNRGDSLSNAGNMVPLHQREDRHKLVALTLASLVAGIVLIINFDRTTHVGSLAKEQRILLTSLHGWPNVFLERHLAEPPKLYFGKRIYSWPWPAIEGEIRTWNATNLLIDLVIGLAIVVVAYWLIRYLVQRYDRWKAAFLK